MKRLLPLLLMALLVGACGGSTPASESPSISPSASPIAEVTPTPALPTPAPTAVLPLDAVGCAPGAPELAALLPTTDQGGLNFEVSAFDCSMPDTDEEGIRLGGDGDR